jgi:valyl-tRNA synthetase
VIADATESFEAYDYARALERTETFFWWYCDYYVELVKGRRYDSSPGAAASVSLALRLSLSALQRLFAPFLPFVCEEVWSWWQSGSIHRAPWPQPEELVRAARGARTGGPEDLALALAADVLREVRKAKSDARRPMRWPVRRLLVADAEERLAALELARGDLEAAGAVQQLETAVGSELAVEVDLAQEPAA